MTQLNFGGKWHRNAIRVNIGGEGAQAHLNGLTLGAGQQHFDQRVVVQHSVGQSESTQLFKGVLQDQAKSTLNGKIFIAKDAQKVASQQYNHNLLLSTGAEANSKPELEVYADDVKANHGATVGQMDTAKLFYLESRGIPREQAKQLLAQAFCSDVLMKVEHRAKRKLAERFTKENLSKFADFGWGVNDVEP
jgi:Fe-S cluster assembly protein SufD